jgi:hypothetical protein
MIRFVMVASLLVGCRLSLESDVNAVPQVCEVNTMAPACVEAEAGAHADLAFIEESIFKPGCAFQGCHDGGNSAQGKIDLRTDKSHDHLVNFASGIDPTRKLVVPNDVKSSYLMLMLQDFPPEEATPPGVDPPARAGFMPMSNATLCCQKLAVIERWINAGAPNKN